MPRPFATSHSRGTKPPCWRAKEALGQDKQLLFKTSNNQMLRSARDNDRRSKRVCSITVLVCVA